MSQPSDARPELTATRPLRRVALSLFASGSCGVPWSFASPFRSLTVIYGGVLLAGLVTWLAVRLYVVGYQTHRRQLQLDPGAVLAARPDADPASWLSVPDALAGTGYLYAVRFSSGSIKVGQTVEPRHRLHRHSRYARAFGVRVVDAWVSVPHTDYIANETVLLAHLGSVASGRRHRREFFQGADFDQVVAHAEQLVSAGVTVQRA